MKVHSLKPIGYMLNKYTALFLVNLFKKSFNGVYNDQISSTDLKKSYIRLPVTNDMIDFNFMENYIKSIEAKMQKLILYHNALALRERERERERIIRLTAMFLLRIHIWQIISKRLSCE